MKTMKYTELEIMRELELLFRDHYFLEHPTIVSSVPDAMAISLWDGMGIHGLEIKRSRSDFLVELRSGKNNHARLACDYWSFVALEGVVEPSDLPRGSGWGLYIVKEGPSIELVRTADRLTPERTIPRDFAARILRAVINDVPETQKRRKSYLKGYEAAVNDLLGISWHIRGNALVSAMNALHERSHLKVKDDLIELQHSVRSILENVDEQVKRLPAMKDWETGRRKSRLEEESLLAIRLDLLKKNKALYLKNQQLLDAAVEVRYRMLQDKNFK